MASAIFIDATIIRLVLVPSTMELLGDANWWFPKWLERIVPRISVEAPPEFAPASPPPTAPAEAPPAAQKAPAKKRAAPAKRAPAKKAPAKKAAVRTGKRAR
jgi:hypothetical protein